MSRATLERYFDAFNRKDIPGMLDCLTEDVAHHVNEGNIRVGREAFEAFCQHMSTCYDETLTEIARLRALPGIDAAQLMTEARFAAQIAAIAAEPDD